MKNRVIKFRVWDKDKKIMRVPHSRTPKYFFEQDIFSGAAMGKDYVFEQFTGLLDKNGVEIYEGDILKFGYNKRFVMTTVEFGEYPDGEGYMDEKHFGYTLELHKDHKRFYPFSRITLIDACKDAEIIRNIHQNLSLLK